MSKLLSADFARLKKDKVFWIGMIFMFVLGILSPVMNYIDMNRGGYEIPLESSFFVYAIYIGILLSAFCSLFVGTEYSDGTIRNKIVIGHGRIQVYFSHFLICAAAGLLMCAAYFLPAGIIGTCLLGFFQTDIQVILGLILCSVIMSLAFTAIFTMVAMLNQNKALVAVINMLGYLFCSLGPYISGQSSMNQKYMRVTYIRTKAGKSWRSKRSLIPITSAAKSGKCIHFSMILYLHANPSR